VFLCVTNNQELTQRSLSFHRVSQRAFETAYSLFSKNPLFRGWISFLLHGNFTIQ
jgi:hypothetical protein